MTPFEVIIISIIYIFCYGFTIEIFIKEEENVWLMPLWTIISLVIAIYYAPLTIGKMLYEKLKDE